ncbi:MAG: hypothetical protein ABII88_10995 [Candidatus Omnitrophota bacterium]
MKNKKLRIPLPKNKDLNQKLAKDKELKKFRELLEYVARSKEDGYVIESFIISYQVVQDIMLPRLRKIVLEQLGLGKLDNLLNEEKSAYSINLQYLALTQDLELYRLLEKARKIRNELAHKLTKHDSIKISQKKANEAIMLIVKDIFGAIQDRWDGVKTVPVLTLYPKGWNDYRRQAFKNLGIEDRLNT